MICLDYLAMDFRCLRGIPVTPQFSKFFCEASSEKCPLIRREKETSKIISPRRSKPFRNIWRKL